MGIFSFFQKKKIIENQFKCIKCKKLFDRKHIHSNQMCVDCFSKTYVPVTYPKEESTPSVVLYQCEVTPSKSDIKFLHNIKTVEVSQTKYEVNIEGNNPFFIAIGDNSYQYKIVECYTLQNYDGLIQHIIINGTNYFLYYKAHWVKNEIVKWTIYNLAEESYANYKYGRPNLSNPMFLGYSYFASEHLSIPYLIIVLENSQNSSLTEMLQKDDGTEPTCRYIDKDKYTTKLDTIVELIISDCRHFGVPENRIEQFLKRGQELNQEQSNDQWMFIAYNLNDFPGYSITSWERGKCNFSYGDCDELNFRFLFQKNTVQNLHTFSITETTKKKAEKFMNDSFERFGKTTEYKKALESFGRVFEGFCVPRVIGK